MYQVKKSYWFHWHFLNCKISLFLLFLFRVLELCWQRGRHLPSMLLNRNANTIRHNVKCSPSISPGIFQGFKSHMGLMAVQGAVWTQDVSIFQKVLSGSAAEAARSGLGRVTWVKHSLALGLTEHWRPLITLSSPPLSH